ncbi:uncharacterized protein LOC144272333 [Eretmochelys imbricata]
MAAPCTRRSPAWSNAKLLDLISIWGEEVVQFQLLSSHRNCDTYGQISRCMRERGHDQHTLQCRVKVKELQNTYHKAWEANHCFGAAPASCHLYKELDVILGRDATSTAKVTVDTSVAHVLVKSGPSQEEEILHKDVEGDPEAEDDSEVRNACSQELFSTPEEACQSQLSELDEAQTGEEAPDMTFGAQPPSFLLPAEWLLRIRKHPQRTKENFLRDVMMLSVAKKQELKEWRDSEKRDQKENASRQNTSTERLLKVMERQVDTLQALLALQTKQLCAHPPLWPLSQSSFPCAAPDTANRLLQAPGFSLYLLHFTPDLSQSSPADSQYPLHSTPVPLQFSRAEVPTALYSKGCKQSPAKQQAYFLNLLSASSAPITPPPSITSSALLSIV